MKSSAPRESYCLKCFLYKGKRLKINQLSTKTKQKTNNKLKESGRKR